jgi:crotonobetainyl-CoA:carnitine CoA-transferase CaiB-like acyl-CoA transferase
MPLTGIKVIEFTHMVMGPVVGAILGELGAEVIRVEPIGGDPTRRLTGSGAGYFPMYNRNKRSVCLDIKHPEGLALARRLVAQCDVLVVDVMGGMFGVIGILAALESRHRTGRGQKVTSALFESAVYLVGQHMAQKAVTGEAARPMPVRISAWAIYDVFRTKDDEQVFFGIVSDALWQKFCAGFGLETFGADPRYRTNAQRVRARPELLPVIRAVASTFTKPDLLARLERSELPFAAVGRPEDLFDDTHLLASGGLVATRLLDGSETKLPSLPLELDGKRPSADGALAEPSQHTRSVLGALGFNQEQLDTLERAGAIAS